MSEKYDKIIREIELDKELSVSKLYAYWAIMNSDLAQNYTKEAIEEMIDYAYDVWIENSGMHAIDRVALIVLEHWGEIQNDRYDSSYMYEDYLGD